MRSPKAILSIIFILLSPAVGKGESALQNADIGEVVSPGGASFQEETLHVQGSGSGIVQAGDSFHYVWQANQGDYSVCSKITPGPASEGAIVVRETEDPASSGLWVGFAESGKINLVVRHSKSGNTSKTEFDAAGSDPIWIQVIKKGGTFSLSSSEDGITWDSFHQLSLTLPDRSLAGFGVSGASGSVVFEGFKIIGAVQTDEESPAASQDSTTSDLAGGKREAGAVESSTASATEADSSSQTTQDLSTTNSSGERRVARKLYVNKLLGNDNNDGRASLKSGEKGPKKTVQAALQLAGDGDEIIIASGTYTLSEINPSGHIRITPVGEVFLNP